MSRSDAALIERIGPFVLNDVFIHTDFKNFIEFPLDDIFYLEDIGILHGSRMLYQITLNSQYDDRFFAHMNCHNLSVRLWGD